MDIVMEDEEFVSRLWPLPLQKAYSSALCKFAFVTFIVSILVVRLRSSSSRFHRQMPQNGMNLLKSRAIGSKEPRFCGQFRSHIRTAQKKVADRTRFFVTDRPIFQARTMTVQVTAI
jgi:hypothetical protein